MSGRADLMLRDQAGRTVDLAKTPRRVVSLVPSLTGLLCSLGLEDLLVGVTKFCICPEHIRKAKQVVGGTKQIHTDRIKALGPDLVLCNKEENTQSMVRELSAVCPVHVSDIITLDDFFELLDQYGSIFDIPERTSRLAEEIRESRAVYKNRFSGPPLKVAYFIWRNPWMLAGGGTFINEMLQEGGFINVASKALRYPVLGNSWPEGWEHPEVVFLSSEPFPFKEEHIEELKELFPNSHFMLVDGMYFSWYGPLLKRSYGYMAELCGALGNG